MNVRRLQERSTAARHTFTRAAGAVAPALAWALLAVSCASQAPAAAPAQAAGEAVPPAEAATAAEPAPSAAQAPPPEAGEVVSERFLDMIGGTVLEPPEGDWWVDEEGRRYLLVEVERQPYHKVLPNGFVMLPPGAAYQLVEEREDTLVVKINDATSVERRAPAPERPTSASLLEDLRALEVGSADRLRFERSGGALPGSGQWRQGFELVDVDGDGNLDIVHGPPRKSDGRPRIFLGDGAGGWRPWREARFTGPTLDYGDVAVADFDGDGELDLAFAVHLRGVAVMRGDGRGGFRQWGEGLPYWVPESGTEAPDFSSRTIEAVDWNRDGRPDLLTLGEGPRLLRQPGSAAPGVSHGDRGAILFLNRGDGRWERYDQGSGRTQIFGDGLAVGDFDGDGRADFAVASRISGATEFVALGREDGGWEDVSLGELARPGVYGSVHAADLDGDGRDELLLGYVASGEGEDWWTGVDLLDLEDGRWHRTPVVAENRNLQAVTALATGDLDGDGRQDVVALTGTGERWVLLAAGDGTFVREQSPELAPREPGCQGYAAAVASLGPDGPTAVILGFAGEPGSEQIFGTAVGAAEKRCPGQGSLEAWIPTS